MAKKQAVGVLLLSKNGEGELVAMLQVRGTWNPEKNAPESYPGACQVTAFGGLEEGEDFIKALLREVAEELGKEFVPVVQALVDDQQLETLCTLDTPEKQVITYGAIVDTDVLRALSTKPTSNSFGGFRMVRREEIDKIADLRTFDRNTGVTDKTVIAMFTDGKEAIRLAFEKLG